LGGRALPDNALINHEGLLSALARELCMQTVKGLSSSHAFMIPVPLVKHLMCINQINNKGEVTRVSPKDIADRSVLCPGALPQKISYDVITSTGVIKYIKYAKVSSVTVARVMIRNIVGGFVDRKTGELTNGGSRSKVSGIRALLERANERTKDMSLSDEEITPVKSSKKVKSTVPTVSFAPIRY
jgi:hypothetical protein